MTGSVRIAMVGALILLIVGEARAECAWVLWMEDDRAVYVKGTDSGSHKAVWSILGASSDKAECQRQIQDEMLQAASQTRDDADVMHKRTGDTLSLAYFPKNSKPTDTITHSQILRYICLPDTVDPRGPKGK